MDDCAKRRLTLRWGYLHEDHSDFPAALKLDKCWAVSWTHASAFIMAITQHVGNYIEGKQELCFFATHITFI